MFNRLGHFVPAAGILALAIAVAACSNQASDLRVGAVPDQVVTGSIPVTLSATSGTVLQGFTADIPEYHWRFVSKPAASHLTNADIEDADGAVAHFTPDVAGVYVLQMTMKSADGTTQHKVKVTSRPIVEAGPDRTVYGSAPVALQARSNAANPSFHWSFVARPEGSGATLDGASAANASFTPDVPGVYRVRASLGGGAPGDTVTISAEHVFRPGVIPEPTSRVTQAASQMAEATSLALAHDGILYIAYQDMREGGKAVVKRLDADKWIKLGGEPASAAYARFMSLAVSPQGIPVVAFQDFSAQGRGGVTVRRFADGKWTTLGKPGFSVGEAEYIALAIAPDGTPWVAYQDFSNKGKGGVTVQKFAGDKWQTAGRAGFSASKASYLSLAIARDGTPWVGFKDYADYHRGASVATFDGERWHTVGNAGFSPDKATFVSLALAPNGAPYVIYQDGGHDHPGSVEKLDDKHWTYVGKSWLTHGEAEFDTIAIAADGTPYIAYQDEIHDGLSVQKFDGKQWQFVGKPGFSSGEAENISLVIAGDGTLYVSWRGESNSDAAEARKEGETEEKEAINVKRFDGKHWVQAGGTVDTWDEDGDREREH